VTVGKQRSSLVTVAFPNPDALDKNSYLIRITIVPNLIQTTGDKCQQTVPLVSVHFKNKGDPIPFEKLSRIALV
jgi:hypothetical protein